MRWLRKRMPIDEFIEKCPPNADRIAVKMIAKVVKKYRLGDDQERLDTLRYWLSRPPAERISAVETLRRQLHGTEQRLQRVAQVVPREQR